MALHVPGQQNKNLGRGECRGDEKGGMVMKKIMVLVVALLLVAPLSALAGMTAFMDMDEMSDNELAATQGQTGITMTQHLELAGGYIAWGDNDGCAGTTAGAGWLTLNNLWATGIDANLTIDVCTVAGEATSWLTIGIAGQTISAGVSEIKLGSAINTGASLGELVIHSLTIQNSVMRITSH
jgi:hypothetical protein